MLPGEFAPWQTVYYYFRRWREEGRLQCLPGALRRTVRREEGRKGEPSALIVDCQSVATSRTGGIASYDAYKNVKGRKRHLAVDTEGLPWNVLVHAAGDHESRWALQVLTPIRGRTDRDKTVFADSAYRGLEGEIKNKLDWTLDIVEREDEDSGFSVDPKRSVARTNLQLAWRLATTQQRLRTEDRHQRDNGARCIAPYRLEPAQLKIKTAPKSPSGCSRAGSGQSVLCGWSLRCTGAPEGLGRRQAPANVFGAPLLARS
jgi:putative transposase